MNFLRLSSPAFVLLCIVLLIPGSGFAVWKRNKNKLPSSRIMKVRTTAYTHSESDHIVYGRKNALDTRLSSTRKYTSAASDWSRFPVGTTFRIRGMNRTFIIDDYGSALVGTDTIDLYQTSRKAMNRWGVQWVEIEITKWGDYDKSRQILNERKGYSHIRKMLVGVNSPKKRRNSPFMDTSPAALPPEPRAISPASPAGDSRAREFRPMEFARTTPLENSVSDSPPSTTRLIARPVHPQSTQVDERFPVANNQRVSSLDLPPNHVKRTPLAAFGRKIFGRERPAASRERNFRPMERTVSVSTAQPLVPEIKPDLIEAPHQPCASDPKRKSRSFRTIAPGN